MSAILFFGDALSASGWRLAGVQSIIPEPGTEAEQLKQLCAPPAQLVLLSAAIAQALPEALQQRLFTLVSPMVLVVPDLRNPAALPDLAETVRKQLGVGQ
ncbi:MAG: Vacuolar H+transporting two-sector ATPase F subunit [Magnetococcales bacterium]|nr:Vacuolar H+transporting two-sector ATPase F subunit [Magnetococcales bacterium]MBF0113893.1 Vacuolar H+transporting two-sector ATPase F subunit [Magnetococcales bacterium]